MKSETDNTESTEAVKTENVKPKKNNYRRKYFYDAAKAKAEGKTKAEAKRIKAAAESNPDFKLHYSCADEQALKILIQSRKTYCRAIQVSTRGVGLIVASSLITAQKQRPSLHIFPLYSMYRVMLAFTEEKLALIYAAKAKKLADVSVYPLKPNVDRVAILSTVTAFPKFAIAYIEGLGIFTHEGIDFVPVLPKNRMRKCLVEEMLYPDPGKIILSNLREMVLSMNSPAMALQCRKEFIFSNPIPGAVYDNNNLLKQENDIMPANYNNHHLRHDVEECNKFFGKHRKLRPSKNWIGRCPSLKSPKGMPGVTVIQSRITRIPYNCTAKELCDKGISFPYFDSVQMFSPIPLQTTEWLHGAACLYREPPEDYQEYPYYPYWNGSDEGSNPYSITTHHAHIIKVLFNMEVETEKILL